jgi:hypothetical protein
VKNSATIAIRSTIRPIVSVSMTPIGCATALQTQHEGVSEIWI